MIRILFIGAVDFSRHCLQEVLQCGGNVVAVLTPDREHASLNSDFADLEAVARLYDVPTFYVHKINDPDTVNLIRTLHPDVIFVFGFSQLISKEILQIPQLGCIGTHPALLPKNRGRHPLIWALVEGLNESGLTFFYIDEGADSGDILWQRSFPITLEDDSGTLYQKIKYLASEAIAEFLPQLAQNNLPRIQQDHSKATYWRKRTEADGEIDWSSGTLQVYNLIRALTRPYVGAHTFLGEHKLIIWRTKLAMEAILPSDVQALPGKVVAGINNHLFVRAGDGWLELLEWDLNREVQLIPGFYLGRLPL